MFIVTPLLKVCLFLYINSFIGEESLGCIWKNVKSGSIWMMSFQVEYFLFIYISNIHEFIIYYLHSESNIVLLSFINTEGSEGQS